MTSQTHAEGERATGRGEAQRALLEAVVDQSPFGELIVEAPSGDVILCNARARELLGEALQNVHDRQGKHPDGRPYEPHEWPLARAISRGETVIDEEIHIVRADGRRFVALARAAPVRDSAGHIVAAVATLVDVTQRRRTQAHDRLLADAGVVLAGELEHAEVLRKLAGFIVPRMADRCEVYVTREDGQLDPSAVILHPPGLVSGGAAWAAKLSEVARSGVAALYSDAALGADVTSAIIAPLISRGRTNGVLALALSGSGRTFDEMDLGTARELAARAALAVDNARLYEAARAAARHRDHVLAVVAHDLRGPLSAIRMTAFTLARDGDAQSTAPGLRRQAELIERAVGRMARLIDDLVDLGALQRGRLAIQLNAERADEIVRDSTDLHRFAAAEREVTLASQVAPDLPLVACDRNRILQVLGNLIGNALKVTTLGGSITVRVDRIGGEVRFAVADTGPGISKENQARLFEPFWRGDESTHRGMGLGLVIVKGIVTTHGGRIWVESALGSGSTFYFTLPIHKN